MDETNEAALVRGALNRHGVFLKKAILLQLQLIPGITILGEEIGSSFGDTRVADIVTEEDMGDTTSLRLVFECKRVDPDRQWVFFPHLTNSHRKTRIVARGSSHSSFFRASPSDYYVCSEGLEFPGGKNPKTPVADSDPIFKAASQLSAAFLGLVQSAVSIGTDPKERRFAPILVSTAKLCVADYHWAAASLSSGKIDESTALKIREVDHLVLKHPAPTPEGMRDADFRDLIYEDPWSQVFTESIYVVRATALSAFLSLEKRAFLASG